MQTVNFYCAHCKNAMAVGPDLLGKDVECPTCHGVMKAPDALDVTFEEPVKKVEGAESIFGETQDSDVFGAKPVKIEYPSGMDSAPAPETEAPPREAPPNEVASESPWYKSPVDTAPEPAPAPQGAILAPENWPAASDAPLPEPPPPQWQPAEQPQWSAAKTNALRDHGASREQRKGANLLLAILAPYSVVMTLVAGWYFYKSANPAATDHPMANIPDIFAQYEPATRKQLSRRIDGLPPVDAPLPPSLLVRLGQTLRVGDLEMTPERVEQAPITVHTVLHDNQASASQPPGEALVLHLRLKNLSSDVLFHPTDPVFDRLYDRRQGSAKPYTQLIANGYHSYGGAIDVLTTNWQRVRRKYVEGQENDDKALPPGEERLTVIVTDPQDTKALDSVKSHSGSEPIVWRVQLRRGLTTFRGRELSVCAVVGVQFDPGDVQRKSQN